MRWWAWLGQVARLSSSSFDRDRFAETHLRLSLDMLRTRHRKGLLLAACLQAKQPFVVDNTNPTVSERAVDVRAARGAGFRVVGYAFRSRVEDCLRRPEARRVPIKGILGTAGRLLLPTLSEGFDKLHYPLRLREERLAGQPRRDLCTERVWSGPIAANPRAV